MRITRHSKYSDTNSCRRRTRFTVVAYVSSNTKDAAALLNLSSFHSTLSLRLHEVSSRSSTDTYCSNDHGETNLPCSCSPRFRQRSRNSKSMHLRPSDQLGPLYDLRWFRYLHHADPHSTVECETPVAHLSRDSPSGHQRGHHALRRMPWLYTHDVVALGTVARESTWLQFEYSAAQPRPHVSSKFVACQHSLCTFDCDMLHCKFTAVPRVEFKSTRRHGQQCGSLNPGNWADGPMHCFDLVLNKYFRPRSLVELKPS